MALGAGQSLMACASRPYVVSVTKIIVCVRDGSVSRQGPFLGDSDTQSSGVFCPTPGQ